MNNKEEIFLSENERKVKNKVLCRLKRGNSKSWCKENLLEFFHGLFYSNYFMDKDVFYEL